LLSKRGVPALELRREGGVGFKRKKSGKTRQDIEAGGMIKKRSTNKKWSAGDGGVPRRGH